MESFENELKDLIERYDITHNTGVSVEDFTDIILKLIRAEVERFTIEEDFDDGMDGDAASALSSVGLGTDEDYGQAE